MPCSSPRAPSPTTTTARPPGVGDPPRHDELPRGGQGGRAVRVPARGAGRGHARAVLDDRGGHAARAATSVYGAAKAGLWSTSAGRCSTGSPGRPCTCRCTLGYVDTAMTRADAADVPGRQPGRVARRVVAGLGEPVRSATCRAIGGDLRRAAAAAVAGVPAAEVLTWPTSDRRPRALSVFFPVYNDEATVAPRHREGAAGLRRAHRRLRGDHRRRRQPRRLGGDRRRARARARTGAGRPPPAQPWLRRRRAQRSGGEPARVDLLHRRRRRVRPARPEEAVAAASPLRPDHHVPLRPPVLRAAHRDLAGLQHACCAACSTRASATSARACAWCARTSSTSCRSRPTSPFIGAEIAIKTMLKGYRVGEMGIQTFPREFGKGNSTSPQNIYRTIVDMMRCHRRRVLQGLRAARPRRRGRARALAHPVNGDAGDDVVTATASHPPAGRPAHGRPALASSRVRRRAGGGRYRCCCGSGATSGSSSTSGWCCSADGLTDPGYLDAHNGHWITVVALDYRLNFRLWGLGTYLPYQVPVVAAHLASAVLLRIVMLRGRRPGVAGDRRGARVRLPRLGARQHHVRLPDLDDRVVARRPRRCCSSPTTPGPSTAGTWSGCWSGWSG